MVARTMLVYPAITVEVSGIFQHLLLPVLVWGSWYGQTRSYPRFFGYWSEQYVYLFSVTSRVTANSRLILDILGIIAQVLDIMGLDILGAIPPSMLQFSFSLVPSDWGGTAGGIYHDPQYFLCAICFVYMIV